MPFLDTLYEPQNERGRQTFGKYYIASGTPFEHGEYRTVARIEKYGGDGQPVEIDECRLPARFFRLRALESTNSVGTRRAPFALTTGSGEEMAELLVKVGEAIAEGMLNVEAMDGQ